MVHWLVLKELAGFLGSVIAVVPWLRDFVARVRAERIRKVRAGGSLGDIVKELRRQDEEWLSQPKILDLLCTIVGLTLIALSFLIGVTQAA